jgi:lipopolysaccharide/colanic/teichoic acid biosynthesis glycosyltransferase
MIVNLHVLNDHKKINDYIRSINSKLIDGGIFVGTMIPNSFRYNRFLRNYPFLLANIIYLFDFIWKRAFPKLPIIKKFYFMLSKGKDRAISLAEGLGRLVFCGFDILDVTEINHVVYFVVKKVKEAAEEKNPYYSPLFKMRRVGKDGKPIFVYKFRTMHPYSELIQNFVYINNKLHEGGKFKDDFRIPIWGKFLRSVWIDELPMIYNFLRGDLKLVGVRPISAHYLSLYSHQHQHRRLQFKPGLVPPYYADMPRTIEEIEKSESDYFFAYEKNPIKTDIKYFLKALNNILLKDKRSA